MMLMFLPFSHKGNFRDIINHILSGVLPIFIKVLLFNIGIGLMVFF